MLKLNDFPLFYYLLFFCSISKCRLDIIISSIAMLINMQAKYLDVMILSIFVKQSVISLNSRTLIKPRVIQIARIQMKQIVFGLIEHSNSANYIIYNILLACLSYCIHYSQNTYIDTFKIQICKYGHNDIFHQHFCPCVPDLSEHSLIFKTIKYLGLFAAIQFTSGCNIFSCQCTPQNLLQSSREQGQPF
ncbi:Hypothetical_protein [Hexamita inflata]|uniref:Hypothetical_protein n=1 Tax=Hexamita inflata TaxID=28002 RepID=A0AA86R5Y3_9EUKA|nr:Hypothetical protein HINF_LOCUS54262 [Hexamita inflata]